MAYGTRQQKVRQYRGQIPSPGRPTVARREDRVRFWAAVARGVMTEDAAVRPVCRRRSRSGGSATLAA